MKRVLMIESEQTNRKQVRQRLEADGYQVSGVRKRRSSDSGFSIGCRRGHVVAEHERAQRRILAGRSVRFSLRLRLSSLLVAFPERSTRRHFRPCERAAST